MSSYGPPRGPYPGQEPPRDEGSHDEPVYDEPSDPWGNQPTDPWVSQPPMMPGVQQPAPLGPPMPSSSPLGTPIGTPGPASVDPDWLSASSSPFASGPMTSGPVTSGPVPPPETGGFDRLMESEPSGPIDNGRQNVLILVVIVLALLLGVGGFATFWLSNRGGDEPEHRADETPPAATAGPGTPTAAQPTTEPTNTAGVPAGDFRSVRVGQCIVNDGTDTDPKIRVVPCGPGTYEVLQRFDGTADKKKCSTVKGYDHHFYFDGNIDKLDVVLCLGKR